jgi:NAD(P)-dependent dehydrogenase (short-subunit alcohol dehydrogenase family)
MPFDLTNKTILITGGGRGIGRGAAELAAASGAIVGIADINADSCHETAAAIEKAGGRAHAVPGDVSTRAGFHAVAEAFAAKAGPIAGLVNAAMWIRYEPIEEVSEETFERLVSVGLKAPVWGAQAVLRHMNPEAGAAIVNFGSPAADQGYPTTAIYASVKGAVQTLTRTLAVELGPKKVRVNAVTPGAVPTPGARAIVDEAGYEFRRRKTPLGRLGRELDIANAIAFLLSDEADFITGALLHVDGGASRTA